MAEKGPTSQRPKTKVLADYPLHERRQPFPNLEARGGVLSQGGQDGIYIAVAEDEGVRYNLEFIELADYYFIIMAETVGTCGERERWCLCPKLKARRGVLS